MKLQQYSSGPSRAAVLFFLDISGSCEYSIAQQPALFDIIKSLEEISEEDVKLVVDMKLEG